MVIANARIFPDDPLHKLHFDEFEYPENFILYLGHERMRIKDPKKIHVLIDFEQPNRFACPKSNHETLQIESYYDKILTICPWFVEKRNKVLGRDLYQHVFFPFSSRYIGIDEKIYDIVYSGNKDYGYSSIFGNYNSIWIGRAFNGYSHKDISYDEKIKLTKRSKISFSNSILDYKDKIQFMDSVSDTIEHIDGIIEQHKARTIEAAFSKSLIVHLDTGQRVIEEIFTPNVDFVYYKEGIFDEILNNFEDYQHIVDNAYNKSINNYTTAHFYEKYLKPLFK